MPKIKPPWCSIISLSLLHLYTSSPPKPILTTTPFKISRVAQLIYFLTISCTLLKFFTEHSLHLLTWYVILLRNLLFSENTISLVFFSISGPYTAPHTMYNDRVVSVFSLFPNTTFRQLPLLICGLCHFISPTPPNPPYHLPISWSFFLIH